MATTSCLVRTRSNGYTYSARTGVGKSAVNTTCTSSAELAALRAGARALGVSEDAVKATLLPKQKTQGLDFNPDVYEVALIEEGGAS